MFTNEIGNIRHSVHSPENLNIYYEGKKKMFLSNSELQVCRIRQTQRQLKLLALPCFQLKTSQQTEKWNFSRKEQNIFFPRSKFQSITSLYPFYSKNLKASTGHEYLQLTHISSKKGKISKNHSSEKKRVVSKSSVDGGRHLGNGKLVWDIKTKTRDR